MDKESYRRGFEDAIDLVLDLLKENKTKTIEELHARIKELKIERLKRELLY